MTVHATVFAWTKYVDAHKVDDLATGRTQTLSSTISVIQYKRERHRPIPPDHKSANTRDHDHMGLSRFLKKRTRAAPRTLFEDRGRRQGAFWVRFFNRRHCSPAAPASCSLHFLVLRLAVEPSMFFTEGGLLVSIFWVATFFGLPHVLHRGGIFGLPRSSSAAPPDFPIPGKR